MQFKSTNAICHYGVKGMKWGVRRYQKKDRTLRTDSKKRQRTRNAEKHVLAYRTVSSAKLAAVSGAASLGLALAGSLATKSLAKKGKTQAAEMIYKMSKKAFDETAFATQIFLGSAVVNGMLTSKKSMSDYLAEESRIRKSAS